MAFLELRAGAAGARVVTPDFRRCGGGRPSNARLSGVLCLAELIERLNGVVGLARMAGDGVSELVVVATLRFLSSAAISSFFWRRASKNLTSAVPETPAIMLTKRSYPSFLYSCLGSFDRTRAVRCRRAGGPCWSGARPRRDRLFQVEVPEDAAEKLDAELFLCGQTTSKARRRGARARSSWSPNDSRSSPGEIPKCSVKPSRMPPQSQSSGGLVGGARFLDHRADDAVDEIEQTLALLGQGEGDRLDELVVEADRRRSRAPRCRA